MKATPAEAFAWGLFRDRQFLGLKFRRQHQIGNYIVDFYCHEKRLVVELDGPVHDSDERRTMDRNRDGYLESLGMTVVRIKNQHLLQHTREALNEIADALSPSPAGRGAGVRVRKGETLFIDARKLGYMIDRTRRDLSPEDIARVADTYHAWRGGERVRVRAMPTFPASAKAHPWKRSANTATSSRPAATSARNLRTGRWRAFRGKNGVALQPNGGNNKRRRDGWMRRLRKIWQGWDLERGNRT